MYCVAVFLRRGCCCREALLNAFSDVDEAGNFTSSITKPRDRFLKVNLRKLKLFWALMGVRHPPHRLICFSSDLFLSAISDEFYYVYSDAYYDTGTP